MKTKFKFLLFGLVCTFACPAWAGLHGLNQVGGIAVEVLDIPSEDQMFNVSAHSVKTDVELRLRQNSIAVVDSGICKLIVTITPLHLTDLHMWAIDVDLRFNQPVVPALALVKEKQSPIVSAIKLGLPGDTWSAGHLLVLGDEKVDHIRDTVRDLTDEFVNEYLAANPISNK